MFASTQHRAPTDRAFSGLEIDGSRASPGVYMHYANLPAGLRLIPRRAATPRPFPLPRVCTRRIARLAGNIIHSFRFFHPLSIILSLFTRVDLPLAVFRIAYVYCALK